MIKFGLDPIRDDQAVKKDGKNRVTLHLEPQNPSVFSGQNTGWGSRKTKTGWNQRKNMADAVENAWFSLAKSADAVKNAWFSLAKSDQTNRWAGGQFGKRGVKNVEKRGQIERNFIKNTPCDEGRKNLWGFWGTSHKNTIKLSEICQSTKGHPLKWDKAPPYKYSIKWHIF